MNIYINIIYLYIAIDSYRYREIYIYIVGPRRQGDGAQRASEPVVMAVVAMVVRRVAALVRVDVHGAAGRRRAVAAAAAVAVRE